MNDIAVKWHQQFALFLQDRARSEWQRALASVGILGTAVTLLLLTASLSIAYAVGGNLFAKVTLPCVAVATLIIWVLYWADRRRALPLNGLLLISIHAGLGVAFMTEVGVGAAAAILFSAAVIFSSALYGFWFALLPTELILGLLVLFRIGELQGNMQPMYIFVPKPMNFDTVVAMGVLLHILLLACSIVHYYLSQANQRLRASETERVQQLYRFAGIG